MKKLFGIFLLVVLSIAMVYGQESFLLEFNQNPNAPLPLKDSNDAWKIDIVTHSRNNWYELEEVWAAHGPNCEPPSAELNGGHYVSSYEDASYICANHAMTTLKAGGYGLIYMVPSFLADWSDEQIVISFDMSTLATSGRDWTDILIVPYEDNMIYGLSFPAPDLDGHPKDGISIEMTHTSEFILTLYDNYQTWHMKFPPSYTYWLTPDARRRDTFEIRLNKERISFCMPDYQYNGGTACFFDKTFAELTESKYGGNEYGKNLDWSQGLVYFGHHSYNPTKSSCPPGHDPETLVGIPCDRDMNDGGTWHWDNLYISNGHSLTLIKPNKRYVDDSATDRTMSFDQPAPPNAHLRFAALGGVQVSFDGGNTYEPARVVDGSYTAAGEEVTAFRSYWHPIPEGVQTVHFDLDATNWWGSAMVKDASIWSTQKGDIIPRTPDCTDGATQSCGSSNVGACSLGTRTCTNGAWSECDGATAPTTEICGNSIDEDCDGSDLLCEQEPESSSRITWNNEEWYLHGVNMPWLNWGCDFGCAANNGVVANQQTIATRFQDLENSNIHVVRWFAFPGEPWQIERDANGKPTGLNDAIYEDFDAALALAEEYDLYYVFALFASPDQIPSSWLTDATHSAASAQVLNELFSRYATHPRIMTWEVFNEPEWAIVNNEVHVANVARFVNNVANQVHSNTDKMVTIGTARYDFLEYWVNQFPINVDYWDVHWYDPMNLDGECLYCTDYKRVVDRFGIDKPLVIGEFYAGADVNQAENRFTQWYNKGFAGAFAWSLFWDHTFDEMQIDFEAASAFSNSVDNIGPKNTVQPGSICGNGIVEAGEACDDGNTQNNDGCSSICTVETPDTVSTGVFTGTYYPNIDFTGTPVIREDPQIDFNWGTGKPHPSIEADTFSVVWEGKFSFDDAMYDFTVVADDGFRVFVDGNEVFSAYKDQPPTSYSFSVPMNAGEHTIKVEYYENRGRAVMQLDWVKDVNGWSGEYFNNADFTDLAYNKDVTAIDFDWGVGAPQGLDPNTFSIRWTKTENFPPGTYQLSLSANNKATLYVDGKPIIIVNEGRATIDDAYVGPYTGVDIEAMLTQFPLEFSTTMQLSGDHEMVIEYSEEQGDAYVRSDYQMVGSSGGLTNILAAVLGLI